MNNNSSLSQSINIYIDDTVGKYIRMIATKYNLDYDELLREWSEPQNQVQCQSQSSTPKKQIVLKQKQSPTPKVVGVVECKSQPPEESFSSESLMKLTKQELQDKCKQTGVRSSGTKNDLVKYLLESKSQSKINTIKTKPPPPFVAQIMKEEERKEEKKPVVNQIVKKISASVPVLNIRRNRFNNYEDINTGFVFDNLSKKVIGKQNADGTVSELTKEDINICNKYKFQFVLPSNLDKNSRVEDVKVEELEDDEDGEGEGDDEVVEEEIEVEAEVADDIEAEDDDDNNIDDEEELLEEEDVIEDDE